jgi:hypothetical protein
MPLAVLYYPYPLQFRSLSVLVLVSTLLTITIPTVTLRRAKYSVDTLMPNPNLSTALESTFRLCVANINDARQRAQEIHLSERVDVSHLWP